MQPVPQISEAQPIAPAEAPQPIVESQSTLAEEQLIDANSEPMEFDDEQVVDDDAALDDIPIVTGHAGFRRGFHLPLLHRGWRGSGDVWQWRAVFWQICPRPASRRGRPGELRHDCRTDYGTFHW